MKTYFEFFAGGGMAHAGLSNGWECLFANDICPIKSVAFAANWGGKRLVVDDIANLTPSRLSGHADLAWASFPCQDLSLAGNGVGLGGERSGTFWGFWKLMKALNKQGRKPRMIALEMYTARSPVTLARISRLS